MPWILRWAVAVLLVTLWLPGRISYVIVDLIHIVLAVIAVLIRLIRGRGQRAWHDFAGAWRPRPARDGKSNSCRSFD
jgi:hypothetical protein